MTGRQGPSLHKNHGVFSEPPVIFVLHVRIISMVAALQMIGTLAQYADSSWTPYGPSTRRGWFDDIILNSLYGATPNKGLLLQKQVPILLIL